MIGSLPKWCTIAVWRLLTSVEGKLGRLPTRVVSPNSKLGHHLLWLSSIPYQLWIELIAIAWLLISPTADWHLSNEPTHACLRYVAREARKLVATILRHGRKWSLGGRLVFRAADSSASAIMGPYSLGKRA